MNPAFGEPRRPVHFDGGVRWVGPDAGEPCCPPYEQKLDDGTVCACERFRVVCRKP